LSCLLEAVPNPDKFSLSTVEHQWVHTFNRQQAKTLIPSEIERAQKSCRNEESRNQHWRRAYHLFQLVRGKRVCAENRGRD
jgi:hypothetical protein